MVRKKNDQVPALAPARTRKRLTREEITPIAREAIFTAAARVVGEVGYAEASVGRITAAAGIAQGTFYLYFPTRQSLFDELLPHARRELLALVRERVAGAPDFLELEERGMAAFLEYVRRNPGFLRILNEAEAVAPGAYRAHYDDVAERFRRELHEAVAAGQIRPLDEAEMHTAVYLMMGARVSLYQMLHRERLEGSAAARAAVGHYMAMVRNWLVPTGAKPARGRAAVPPPARVQA
jgi:AcrR family transcriptional regulator